MSDEDPFESPKYSVALAESEIADLITLFKARGDDGSYTVVTEFNPQNRLYEAKLKEVKPIPWNYRGRVSHVIKDLRDALDQVVSAATEYIIGRPVKQAHFPFGESADDLENSLSRKKARMCNQIAPELYNVLRRIEPYPTTDVDSPGDDFLKLLSKVSGPNKHRITLTTGLSYTELSIKGLSKNPTLLATGNGPGSLFPTKDWNDKKGELIIAAYSEGGQANFSVDATLQIVFGNSALKNVPVLWFLEQCHLRVAKAVQNIEAEALRIGPRPDSLGMFHTTSPDK